MIKKKTKPIKLCNLKHSTEWAGYYQDEKTKETKLLGAKGFNLKSHDKNTFRYLINSIVYLYATDPEKDLDENIKYIEGEIDSENVEISSVMYFILFLQLKELYEKLINESYFFYDFEKNNIAKIKGRINFSKSLQVNHGLMHKHVCTYRKISFDHPLLSLIKEFYIFFTKEIQLVPTCSSLSEELLPITSHIEYMFSETSPLRDYIGECSKVCSCKYDNDFHFSGLMNNIKYLSQFYMDNHLFFSQNKNETLPKTEGFVFNLNRPFEIVLKRCMQSIFGDGEEVFPDISKFTQAKYFKQYNSKDENTLLTKHTAHIGSESQVKNIWLPDCWFKLGNKVIILDAKHKVLSTDKTTFLGDEDTEDDDEDQVGFDRKTNKINRNDLFQLVTYMSMHPNRIQNETNIESNNIYGLVGLHEDDKFRDKFGEYTTNDEPVVVKFFAGKDDASPDEKIKIVPIRFGQFLLDLGEWINYEKDHTSDMADLDKKYIWLFQELGRQIAFKLGINEAFKDLSNLDFWNKLNLQLHESHRKFNSFWELENEFFKIDCLINFQRKDEFLTLLSNAISSGVFPIDYSLKNEEGLLKRDDLLEILEGHLIICDKSKRGNAI